MNRDEKKLVNKLKEMGFSKNELEREVGVGIEDMVYSINDCVMLNDWEGDTEYTEIRAAKKEDVVEMDFITWNGKMYK